MLIHDLSLPISPGMLVWPGVTGVQLTPVAVQDQGAVANESLLAMHVHNGTHIDAPLHFIPGGLAVDDIPLDVMIGPALVIDVPVERITADFLQGCPIPPGAQRVLFHTRNSLEWVKPEPRTFCPDYVAITEDGARWLVEHGIRLVGVDYLSVAPYDAPAPTHRVFLSAGVILVESLNLNGIAPGMYQLACLPLNLVGCEGSPARVVLID